MTARSLTARLCALPALIACLLAPAAAWAAGGELGQELPLLSVLPFAGLLLCIAVFPLALSHFWESNRNKLLVSLAFGLPVAIWIGLKDYHVVLHELQEYTSFIMLLGALFTISGGLVLRGDIRATPSVNTTFLAVGAVLANFIGTTGASMVLIRPMLRTNSERRHTRHIPIFFIFVVSNLGGLLTPLGDPPLFLGYLRGVPFFWTLQLWPLWLFTVGVVLAVFYSWDRLAYAKESPADLRLDREQVEPLSLAGKQNILLLGGVIGCVFLPSPWRELGMLGMAAVSVAVTPRPLRQENGFTYHPILEVAALFIGIFMAMIPALLLLQARGAQLGVTEPWQFFWITGGLSSFLDNAPTYLTFLSLAQGLGLNGDVVGVPSTLLRAISAGAVFMGANSYIGNGPNFMVKAIADEAKLPAPNFFGYMAYSLLILGPIFVLVTLVFFR